MYYFRYDTPILARRFGAFHTAELPLVLRLVRYPESEDLSRLLANAWSGFARAGDPSQPGLVWPAYSLPQRATAVFDAGRSSVVDDPDRDVRLALQRVLPPDRPL